MKKLSNLLKELRKQKKKSLRLASKDIGISHTYLDSLEKGYDPRTKKERNPTPDVLKKLSDYYNVPYINLMSLAGYVNDDGAVQTDSLHKAFGINPSEQERLKNNKLASKGSELNILKINLDYALKDETIRVYYKDKLMTKEEKENVNQLIDIHLKER